MFEIPTRRFLVLGVEGLCLVSSGLGSMCWYSCLCFMFGVHVLVGLLVHALVSSHALACSARTCIITRTCMQRTHALACSALACSASHLHAAHALACSTYACNSTCTRTYACHRLQHTRTQHTHTHICDVPYICSRVSSRVSRFVFCVSDALCFDAVRGP